MTYNVNFGLAGDTATLAAIDCPDCDVVFLQETTPTWEALLRETFSGSFPHMAFRHSGGAGGLAVLSKLPFTDADYLEPPPGGWFPAWRVVLETALGPVQVLQVHLRPPISDSGSLLKGYFTTSGVRTQSIERFTEALDESVPTLVVGDFNEDEDGDAVKLLLERGMGTALLEFAPDATTWRWDTAVGRISWALDHIVYDPRLTPLSAQVLERGRSDHLPVVAVFEKTN